MNIKKFWDEGISFDTYLKNAKYIIENPKTEADKSFLKYYELGVQRMNRMVKSYEPDVKQVETFAKKNFKGKILIIAEAWCGDCSQVLPCVVKFFEKVDVKITPRDGKPSLIDDFIIDGGKNIPVVIFLDEKFNVIAHWGPRPKFGKELLKKHKSNPEKFPKEDFYNELQKYYAKNKGYDTIQELLELI